MNTPHPTRWTQPIADWTVWARAQSNAESTLNTRNQHLWHYARTIGVADPWQVSGHELLMWFGSQTTWAQETRRGRRMTLRSFYRYGVEAGLVDVSPALRLPAVKASDPNPQPAPDHVWSFALAAAGKRERLMIRLAGEHGMRREEVAQVHTRHDVLEDLMGWSLLVHGKGRKDRIVPLLDDVAAELRAMPDGYAFPGADHGHLSARWVGRLVGDLLPGEWTMHKLRHRAATRWHEATGGDTFQVQELLGHASPATTRRYVKIRNDKLRATVNAARGVERTAA